MHSFATARMASVLALSLLTLAGCERSVAPTAIDHLSAHADNAAVFSHQMNSEKPGPMLLAVRKSTSRFNSTKQAIAAGHVPTSACVSRPGAAMGQHWANQSLIDPVFDPSRPEVLLYEPSGDGKLKLVAVEYVVVNVGQARPTFDGHLFDIGGAPPLGATPHWTLHVWVHRDNPSGLYAPFNPNVSCN